VQPSEGGLSGGTGSNTVKIVYLDQNKWIELARARHGKLSDVPLGEALAFIRHASASGTHVFPLSAIHYMETARISGGSRARLGSVMWELSGGHTLASFRLSLVRELEDALTKRFPQVVPRPLNLIGSGAAHAFGNAFRTYDLPEPYRSRLPPYLVEQIERVLRAMMEEAILTGVGPRGVTMVPFRITEQNLQFMNHLATLHADISRLPRDRWEDALYAMSLSDIQEPLNEVLEYHGLTSADLERLGRDGLRAFVDDLPSRRVDLHLHRQVLRNPALVPKRTDLEDWGGLGPAAAHCDVLVCERHFASLLRRDGFRPRAEVLTDVRALPRLP